MKQEFKDAYQKELSILKERAALFAQDYPGLADRLGGLLEENLDPAISGLLEGAAFLAARVQVNLQQQFRTFTHELLEQLCPELNAPLPSAMIVQGKAPEKPADLVKGRWLSVHDLIEASFVSAARRVACRFRLAEPIEFWPVELTDAQYFASATGVTALGVDGDAQSRNSKRTAAGLAFSLRRTDGAPIGGLLADELPIHFLGDANSTNALYEQVFADTTRVTLRWLDKHGEPVFRSIPIDTVEQVGFSHQHPLFEGNDRLFPGFISLLEYFAFPAKFLGMRLTRLQDILRGIDNNSNVQIIFEFSRSNSLLETQFEPEQLALFCAPAVNLFIDSAKPITLDKKRHKLSVTPNRSPQSNFEIHRLLSVRAQYEGQEAKVDVLPLYAIPKGDQDPRQALYYTVERTARRLTQRERRAGGTQFRYEGTETSLTLYEPPDEDSPGVLILEILCSNRHLPEILPIAEASFYLVEDREVGFSCVSGPSEPREAMTELEVLGPHRTTSGDNYWRLISALSLSYRGLLGPDGTGNVDALKETLRMLADPSNKLNEASIGAIRRMQTKSITRTIRRNDGYHPARGIEVTLTFDDDRIDQASIIPFSAVIERFLADYASVNTFTQTVVQDQNNVVLKRWPPRGGTGPLA